MCVHRFKLNLKYTLDTDARRGILGAPKLKVGSSNAVITNNEDHSYCDSFRIVMRSFLNKVHNLSDMFNRNYMAALSAACLLAVAGNAMGDDLKFHPIGDGSIYEKPFTNLYGKWNSETGIAAPLATDGNFVFKYNLAYIQTFPLKWKVGPQWTAGAAIVYEFDKKSAVKSGIYTKAKNNLQGLWQEESGYTARTRMGQYGLVLNAGYLWNYPYKSHQGPLWQVGLSLNYYFK